MWADWKPEPKAAAEKVYSQILSRDKLGGGILPAPSVLSPEGIAGGKKCS